MILCNDDATQALVTASKKRSVANCTFDYSSNYEDHSKGLYYKEERVENLKQDGSTCSVTLQWIWYILNAFWERILNKLYCIIYMVSNYVC